MNAHMNEKIEYYVAKNALRDSKVHCKQTVLCELQFPVRTKGTRAQSRVEIHINNTLR